MRASESISNGLPVTFAANQIVNYNYNQLNQALTSAPPIQLFSFDNDGNLTHGYTPAGYIFNAAYDAENRLKSLIFTNGFGVVVSNQYIYRWTDCLSEIQQYQNGILTNDTRFVRAGYLPLQERTSNNAISREYAWDYRKVGGIGGLLNLLQAGQSYSYAYDGKGNVSTILNNSQNIVASYTYGPFGSLLNSSGVLDQPFTFSTKPFDPLTGLSYFGIRFYSPALGRWLNRDPLGEGAGINPYEYSDSNPVNFLDAFGLDTYWVNSNPWLGIVPGQDSTPTANPISHSFIAIIQDGKVVNTYSWLNTKNGNGSVGKWWVNRPVDMCAAQSAYDSNTGASWVGDDVFDVAVGAAFQQIGGETGGYWNWLDPNRGNCKEHAQKLIDVASQILEGRRVYQAW
jgi:RHS repeat-associated protein